MFRSSASVSFLVVSLATACTGRAPQTAHAQAAPQSPASASAPAAASAAPPAAPSAEPPPAAVAEAEAPEQVSHFESTYRGKVANKPVQATLQRNGHDVTGTYRYGKAQQDLLLRGTVNDAGAFELEESNESGLVTGYWTGHQLEPAVVVGIWLSPDRTRQLPLQLGEGQFTTLPRVGQKVTIFSLRDAKSLPGCSYDLTLPQVANLASKALERRVNQQLRVLGTDNLDSFCNDSSRDAQSQATATRAYQVTAIRDHYVALRFDSEVRSGMSHGMHGTNCHVLDTSNGRTFTLAEKLDPSSRARFSQLLNQAKNNDPNIKAIEAGGAHTAELQVTERSTLCLTDSGIDIQLDDYELGGYAFGRPAYSFRAADVRTLFNSELSRALFGD